MKQKNPSPNGSHLKKRFLESMERSNQLLLRLKESYEKAFTTIGKTNDSVHATEDRMHRHEKELKKLKSKLEKPVEPKSKPTSKLT